jgi:tyrosinase
MQISRRSVLLGGAVIGAGLVANNVTGMEALAAGQPPERRTLQGLAWNDPIVATYRDAVGQMKQKQPGELGSWASLAGIHGTDPGAYHFCPHGNWYFLPWHRAYVLTCERFVRQLTGNNDFAMPFWDWTNNPTMPDVFLSPTTPDGKTNWLFVDDQDFGQHWQRTWPARTPMPPQIVGPTVLQRILNATDYEEFATSRPDGQDSVDASWVLDGSGAQGVLEGLAHNMVHNNIGGWMPSAMSPRDPIFFMHHCNIDRIWAVWNSLGNNNSKDPLWTGMTFANNFVNTDGSPSSPAVSELFVPETLGYSYGLTQQVASIPASPNLVALQSKLVTLHATPKANIGGVRRFSAAPSGEPPATVTAPLAVSVNIDPALVASVVARKPVPAGAELLNFALAREQRATGTQVLAFVRDVTVTDPQETEYRVFLDHPDFTPQVPEADPSYVGSFAIFVHGGHGSHGAHQGKPSFVLDLTAAMQRVHGAQQAPVTDITLQFLPVANRPDAARVGTLLPGQVEVVFINS